jgi:hypothetical protein
LITSTVSLEAISICLDFVELENNYMQPDGLHSLTVFKGRFTFFGTIIQNLLDLL